MNFKNSKSSNWRFIIQPEYEKLPMPVWRNIKESWSGIKWRKSGFNKDGYEALDALTLWKKQSGNKFFNKIISRLQELIKLNHKRNCAIDIDHRDNWAADVNGNFIVLDPIA